MASVSLAVIAAALNVIHASKFEKSFREDSTVLNLIDIKKADPNEDLTFAVKFKARTAGGAVADGADMEDEDFDHHVIRKGNLPWARYRAGVKVNDGAIDIAEQRGNGFGGRLIQDEVDDAVGKIRDDVSVHLFSGNPGASPAQLGGLARVIADTAGDDYAGIANDTGENEDWAANVGSLSDGTYTLDDLHKQVIRPVINATGRRPDWISADPDEFDYIASLLDSNADAMQTLIANGPYGFLQSQVGSRIIIAKGVPIIEDRHNTTKTLYGISRRHIRIRYVPMAAPAVTPAQVRATVKALTGYLPPEAEVAQRMRSMTESLTPRLVPLDKTGLSTKLMLVTPQMQLEPRRRDAHSKAVVS